MSGRLARGAALLTLGVAVLSAGGCDSNRNASPPPATGVTSLTAVHATPDAAMPRTVAATGAATPTVIVDPGHGGDEVGAAAYDVTEKHSNLDMALRVERELQAAGVRVVLTRRADARAGSPGSGPTPIGYAAQRLDLQARVDLANAEHADAFVSLHSNGSLTPGERGIEVWYDANRPFSAENRRLGDALLTGVIDALQASGISTPDRGVKDDRCLRAFQGRCFPLFVLGPERVTTRDEVVRRGGNPEALGFTATAEAIQSRAAQMPGALIELLFITDPDDARLLRDDRTRDAMARGVAAGVLRFLGRDVRR